MEILCDLFLLLPFSSVSDSLPPELDSWSHASRPVSALIHKLFLPSEDFFDERLLHTKEAPSEG